MRTRGVYFVYEYRGIGKTFLWKTHDAGIRRRGDIVLNVASSGSGYHQKDRKPSQNDKTEHGMEKTVQNQGQSPKMPKSNISDNINDPSYFKENAILAPTNEVVDNINEHLLEKIP
ncbi:ATP-dependent DNA helicase PIF1-like protein [Tanacetum coccineum]|uniref:ATP-dependent DNA helicase n=1 Tax=Tanacetum coccineum TaxID=301880 RepID=A0ABQ5E8P2_9ASTR